MHIRLLSLIEGAAEASGIAVIIDVYRAFTTAAVAFRQGADCIILVDAPRKALKLKRDGRGDYCMGETGGIKIPEFDFGNSPYEVSQIDLKGKILIQSTSSGTKGAVAAKGADKIFITGLVNAAATVAAILAKAPSTVSIVAMGWNGTVRSDEDEQCALYLRNLLMGCRPDRTALRSLVLSAHESLKFDDPLKPHFDPRDRDLALAIDSIDIAMRVREENGLLVARAE